MNKIAIMLVVRLILAFCFAMASVTALLVPQYKTPAAILTLVFAVALLVFVTIYNPEE